MPLTHADILDRIQILLSHVKAGDASIDLDFRDEDLSEKEICRLLTAIARYPELKTKLESIDLSHKYITDLSALNDILKLFQNLKVVRLCDNGLKKVPSGFSLSKLEELDLSYNQLNFLPKLELPSLKTLNLENNKLLAAPEVLTYTKLQSLDIKNNETSFFAPDLYDQYTTIKNLSIQLGNKFSSEVMQKLNDLRQTQTKNKAARRTPRANWSELLNIKKIPPVSTIKVADKDGYEADSDNSPMCTTPTIGKAKPSIA